MPMFWESRRKEKNKYFVDYVLNELGYKHFVNREHFEQNNKALEGRGCLIVDLKDKVVYAGRTNKVCMKTA